MSSLLDLPFSYLFSKLVSQSPNVRRVGDQIVATSGWKSQLWGLGFGGRRVVIDPKIRVVRFFLRRFWFFRTSRRIEFDWIASVDYRYAEVSPGWGAHQEADLYTVDLALKNGEHLTLFRFFGEGDFVNNGIFPDWFYWEDQIEASITRGNQDTESSLYANLAARMIGVPLTNGA